MGNSAKGKSSSSEKSSPPAVSTKGQKSAHVYPEWATMQAFYGPQLAMPPYVNSAVASHALPLYMWGAPQSMIPPYGGPYAAFYANGGVYAHVSVPVAGTSESLETLAKSSENTDGGLAKKFKNFDSLAISVGNGNDDSAECETNHKELDSDDHETERSSDGSNGVAKGTHQGCKKRRSQGSPNRDGKAQKERIAMPVAEHDQASDKIMDEVPLPKTRVKTVENAITKLELKDPSFSLPSSPTSGLQPSIPNKDWLLNERELKRERRKQSNRESARRSRLRKQAETEELTYKVKALAAENMTLKSEMNELRKSSEKLKLENAALMDMVKLRDAQVVQREEATLDKIRDSRSKLVSTENLLERVDDSAYDESYESSNSGPGVKLHQLLDPSARTDAVAAG